MGNWFEISEYMKYFNRYFTPQQVRAHYEEYYLTSESFEPVIQNIMIEIFDGTAYEPDLTSGNKVKGKRYFGRKVKKNKVKK